MKRLRKPQFNLQFHINPALVGFAVMMFALGISDSLRGVFAPVFSAHFSLSTTQVSFIVTASYLGNLVFLLCGGYFVDKFDHRRVLLAVTGLWMGALLLFVLTDSYPALLCAMFLAMGASTLLSTTINVVTPLLCAAAPGLTVNLLSFIQGVGTSGSQKVAGTFADGFPAWRAVNGMLLLLGALCVLILLRVRLPAKPVIYKESAGIGSVVKSRSFLWLVLLFGVYFVAEHGIMNWLVLYATDGLGYPSATASTYLSIFFLGITLGRFLLSPLVDKLGVLRSIRIFSLLAGLLYCIGGVFSGPMLLLLSFSGIFFSILYPTMVLMIRRFYPSSCIGLATGTIISAGTVFDIGFNIAFGAAVDAAGYRASFFILPASMALYCILYLLFQRRAARFEAVPPDAAVSPVRKEL